MCSNKKAQKSAKKRKKRVQKKFEKDAKKVRRWYKKGTQKGLKLPFPLKQKNPQLNFIGGKCFKRAQN